MNKELYIKEKEAEYKFVNNCIELFSKTLDPAFIVILNDTFPAYKINVEKDINNEIKRIVTKLKYLRNKINIKKVEFSKRYKVNEVDSKKELDADSEALHLEKALDLKYPIDVDKTSLSKFCKMITLARKKSKTNGENKTNGKRRVKRVS